MSTTGTTVDGEKGFRNGAAPPARSKPDLASTILRLLAFAATLSAFIVMITNRQSISIPTPDPTVVVKLWSKYSYSDAFIWFVVANCIAFVYSLLAGIIGAVSHSPLITKHLIITDLLVAMMLMSAASAATAVAYIGQNGLDEAQWNSICGSFERYCHHVAGALIASFLGWLFLMIAIFMGLKKLAAIRA